MSATISEISVNSIGNGINIISNKDRVSTIMFNSVNVN